MSKPVSSLVSAALVLSFGAVAHAVPLDSDTVANVAEKVTPAVVNITTERTTRVQHPMQNHPLYRDYFGPNGSQGPQRREMGAGSGVVISADGYIVTNNHVIEGADKIKVVFADQSQYEAKLIGTDKPSDVALIKIETKRIAHLPLGDSSKVRLGEFVLAIGNPFGVGQTLTMGIVSAKGRANIGIVEYEDFIQTDAAINPGNSGGALINLKGELIGINTAILSRSGGAHGIGFAVPSNMVGPILRQIKAHGRVRRGWLGVAIQDLTPDLASSLDLKDVEGVLVSDVMKDGPAAKANLKAGDVITKVNGRKTLTSADLRNRVALLGPGATAKLQVMRDGKTMDLSVKLDEKEDKGTEEGPEAIATSPLSGLRLADLDPGLRRKLNAPPTLEGVVVVEIESGSPGESAGVRAGDVITRVDKQRIRAMGDVEKLDIQGKDRVLLRVWRRGAYLFLVVRD